MMQSMFFSSEKRSIWKTFGVFALMIEVVFLFAGIAFVALGYYSLSLVCYGVAFLATLSVPILGCIDLGYLRAK